VDIVVVEGAADQRVVREKQTFMDIGIECAKLVNAGNNIAVLVRKLQAQDILLQDRASLTLAREYMRMSYNPQNQEKGLSENTLQTYASRLRDYLHMPPKLVPDNICISAPVRDWVMIGHEIDVKFEADWWHGVVLSSTARKLKVFWVGMPKLLAFSARSKNTDHLNPVLLDRAYSFFRPHQEGARSGSDTTYNVEWIQANEMSIPSTFRDIVDVPGDKVEELEEEVHEKTAGSGKKQLSKVPETSSGKGSELKKSGQGIKDDKSVKKPIKRPMPRECSASTGSPSACNGEGVKEVVRPKRQALKPSPFDWLSPFLGCDVIMDGLMQLEQAPALQTDSMFFSYYLMLLEKLRRGQGCIYNAPTKFKNYYEAQKLELLRYNVFNVEASPVRRTAFIGQIDTKFRATYADVFTRNELAVIGCLLAYPGFSFCNINQKKLQSDGMTRGMAFVPSQLESFFHKRLRKLGLIDDVAHPKYMEPLSAVVLSSTYCYHQLVTWEEGQDWLSLNENAWKLDLFPDCLGVNGIYVRVGHTLPRANCVLYAQVVSAKTCSSLKLESWNRGNFGTEYARVIVVEKTSPKEWTARVHVWLSIGPFQADDPICLAKFKLVPSLMGPIIKVGTPEMFSHLDAEGNPVYQAILKVHTHPTTGKAIHPTVTYGDKVVDGVPLEYGPKMVTRRVPVEQTFRPRDLKTQAPHCDGNFFHAK
jgi:hypothetical protein